MKCPKCGFVSYPGLAQCKKCGHRFIPAPPKTSPPPVASPSILSLNALNEPPPPLQPAAVETPPPPPTPSPQTQPPERPKDEAPPLFKVPSLQADSPQAESAPTSSIEFPPQPTAHAAPPEIEFPQTEPPSPEPPHAEPPRPWREELSERVESFRRRRARLKGGFDPTTNLDLDFDRDAAEHPSTSLDMQDLEPDSPSVELDGKLGDEASPEGDLPVLEALPLDSVEREPVISSSAAAQADEVHLEFPRPESEPVEIVLESPADHEDSPTGDTLHSPVAPLGTRFVAGVVDALVLLAGSGVFALIFWRAGGRFSLRPLNLGIASFIAAFFIFAYFGLFTAITFSTPGLLWMGLEVRNAEGDPPRLEDSLWRAFGYLISISALMLGFLWAAFDSEALTWHDRMSGTFVQKSATKH